MRFGFQKATLVRNGLLIVAVPLCVSLVFIGYISHLLQQSEQETAQKIHLQKVISAEISLLAGFFEAVTQMSEWSLSKSPTALARYHKTWNQLGQSFAEARMLVGNDPEQQKSLDRMELIRARLFSLVNSVTRSATGGFDFTLVHITGLRTQIESLLQAYEHEGAKLINTERAKGDAYPHVTTQLIQRYLLLGILLNFVLSLMAALFFFKTITERLLQMRDNMLLLASEKPLNPTVSGKDEIAMLDRWFHQMAGSLADAKKTEREILENMPVGLVIINEHGVIELTNSTTEEMFCSPGGSLIGESLPSLFGGQGEDDKQSFSMMISRLGLGRSSELLAKRKNGQTFPVDVSLTELNMHEGRRLLTTMVDVTQRHEIERLKREFVAMVSHDLRTPLTSVQSTLALATAGALGQLSERGQTMAKKAEGQIVRLVNLISDLLFIEKMEAGKFDIRLEDVDLADILMQSIEAVQREAQQNNVVIEAPPTEARCSADPARLVQVIVNLLSNAVKFSPPNGVVNITIEEAPEWLEVRVADHGRGIPPDYRELIFERFAQVADSDSREKGGTGLGLPICKLIIEGHRGRIGVESTNGHGSTFWFRIPKTASAPSCA